MLFKCKEQGMIDIKNKKCKCGKSVPYFNFKEFKKAICCSKCKEQGMIDIKNKKCKCGRQPCFNFHYSTKPICCSKCKEVGMIDIKNKKKNIDNKRTKYYNKKNNEDYFKDECNSLSEKNKDKFIINIDFRNLIYNKYDNIIDYNNTIIDYNNTIIDYN